MGFINHLSTLHNKLIVWIKASRLRTLPLAFAVTGMGNLTAAFHFGFDWNILLFSVLTTLLLQILSNLANDYGDSIHGADSLDRKGPRRAVQSGAISKKAMLNGILILAAFSLASGLWLLWISFHSDFMDALPLLLVGLLAIAAAYFYTNGRKPYGYQAMGDVSVFLFFGLVAVLATQYLHTKSLHFELILPACAMGFWSTAVLNINNMRDIPSDKRAGKETVPTKLGLAKAKKYHIGLVLGGIICLLLFALMEKNWAWLGFIPGSLLMVKSTRQLIEITSNEDLDPYLKPQALGTLFAVLGMVFCFWIRNF